MRRGSRTPIIVLGLAIVAGVAWLVFNSGAAKRVERVESDERTSSAPDVPVLPPTTLAASPARRVTDAPKPDPKTEMADGKRVGVVYWSSQVLDADGRPVVGAFVRPVAWIARREGELTDAEGRFTLEVAESEAGAVVVSIEGTPDAVFTRAELDAGKPIRMPKGERISGTVRDRATGEAITGIPIYARPAASPASAPCSVGAWDTDGTFTVRVAEPGNFVIDVGTRWHGVGPAPTDVWVPAKVQPVAAGTLDLVVSLDRGLSIEGEIVDDVGQRLTRLASVDVVGRTAAGDPDYTTRHIVRVEAGVLRVPGLVRGRYDLYVKPEATGGDPGSPDASATVVRDVAAGTQGLTIRLTRGFMMKGRLEDGEGKPVFGTGRVYANRDGESGSNHAVVAQLVGDGTFSIGPLDDGLRYTVVADRFAGRRIATVSGVAPRDRDALVLVLRPGVAIHGRVETPDGKPAPAGVPIGVVSEGPSAIESGSRVFGYTQQDGSYVVDGLAGGTYSIEAGGGASGYLGTLVKRVKPGVDELVLKVTGGAELSGTLVDEKGDPVSATSLEADDGARMAAMRPFAQVGADGKFFLHGLRAGSVRLSVRIGEKYVVLGAVTAPGVDLKVTVPAK